MAIRERALDAKSVEDELNQHFEQLAVVWQAVSMSPFRVHSRALAQPSDAVLDRL